MKKKIVVLTGAGMSVESGLRTFRDADGLWEEYPVQQVATHEGWEADPTLVTNFYNMLRKKCWGVKPNEGHKLVAALEDTSWWLRWKKNMRSRWSRKTWITCMNRPVQPK